MSAHRPLSSSSIPNASRLNHPQPPAHAHISPAAFSAPQSATFRITAPGDRSSPPSSSVVAAVAARGSIRRKTARLAANDDESTMAPRRPPSDTAATWASRSSARTAARGEMRPRAARNEELSSPTLGSACAAFRIESERLDVRARNRTRQRTKSGAFAHLGDRIDRATVFPHPPQTQPLLTFPWSITCSMT
jgi:hypothetical protein